MKQDFGKTLKKIREALEFSQSEMAIRMGLDSSSSYGYYEKIKKSPKYETLLRISDALGLDIDEFCYYIDNGFEKGTILEKDSSIPKPYQDQNGYNFGTTLRNLRKSKGLSIRKVAMEMGIAFTTYHHYEKQKWPPADEKIQKIASVLKIEADELRVPHFTEYRKVKTEPAAGLTAVEEILPVSSDPDDEEIAMSLLNDESTSDDNHTQQVGGYEYNECERPDGTISISVILPPGDSRKKDIRRTIQKLRALTM